MLVRFYWFCEIWASLFRQLFFNIRAIANYFLLNIEHSNLLKCYFHFLQVSSWHNNLLLQSRMLFFYVPNWYWNNDKPPYSNYKKGWLHTFVSSEHQFVISHYFIATTAFWIGNYRVPPHEIPNSKLWTFKIQSLGVTGIRLPLIKFCYSDSLRSWSFVSSQDTKFIQVFQYSLVYFGY